MEKGRASYISYFLLKKYTGHSHYSLVIFLCHQNQLQLTFNLQLYPGHSVLQTPRGSRPLSSHSILEAHAKNMSFFSSECILLQAEMSASILWTAPPPYIWFFYFEYVGTSGKHSLLYSSKKCITQFSSLIMLSAYI